MARGADESFVDLSNETSQLGIKVVSAVKDPSEGGEHLGALVHSTHDGKITTKVNYKKLISKWTARFEARDSRLSAMEDKALLQYISTIMVGVALYVGSLSENRLSTLQFIRYFHTRVAWSYLLRRYSSKEITRNDQLYYRNSLRLPTYKELRSKVDRLCVSIQLSLNVRKVRKGELVGFMEAAKKYTKSKLFGLWAYESRDGGRPVSDVLPSCVIGARRRVSCVSCGFLVCYQ